MINGGPIDFGNVVERQKWILVLTSMWKSILYQHNPIWIRKWDHSASKCLSTNISVDIQYDSQNEWGSIAIFHYIDGLNKKELNTPNKTLIIVGICEYFVVYQHNPIRKALFDSTESIIEFSIQKFQRCCMVRGSQFKLFLWSFAMKFTEWLNAHGFQCQLLQLSITEPHYRSKQCLPTITYWRFNYLTSSNNNQIPW